MKLPRLSQTGLTMFRLPRLNVVMLGLFQVALHLVLLRDVFVGVVQEFLFDGPAVPKPFCHG